MDHNTMALLDMARFIREAEQRAVSRIQAQNLGEDFADIDRRCLERFNGKPAYEYNGRA